MEKVTPDPITGVLRVFLGPGSEDDEAYTDDLFALCELLSAVIQHGWRNDLDSILAIVYEALALFDPVEKPAECTGIFNLISSIMLYGGVGDPIAECDGFLERWDAWFKNGGISRRQEYVMSRGLLLAIAGRHPDLVDVQVCLQELEGWEDVEENSEYKNVTLVGDLEGLEWPALERFQAESS
jgi:hypothetical protein